MKTLTALILLGLSGCIQVNVLNHDEDMAAQRAVEFVKAAFIDRNNKSAYTLISEQTRGTVSLSKFSEITQKMHPEGFPETIVATQFESIPGQPMMNIILVGTQKSNEFFYRMVMVGTTEKGYFVGGFFRSNGPYPGNPTVFPKGKLLRPLKQKYSTATK